MLPSSLVMLREMKKLPVQEWKSSGRMLLMLGFIEAGLGVLPVDFSSKVVSITIRDSTISSQNKSRV